MTWAPGCRRRYSCPSAKMTSGVVLPYAIRPATAALLAAPVLVLAVGCSSRAGSPTAAATPQPTGAPVTGRTLTQAQLLGAGLTQSELPSHVVFIPVPDGHWHAASPSATMPTAKPGCQPLVDLIFGTGKAGAEVDVGFQASGIDVGEIQLASYTPSEAGAFFQSVRQAVKNCPDIAYTSFVGPNDGTFEPLPASGVGDDSLSFGMIRQGGGTVMDRFEYVRVGASTVLVMLDGMPIASPPPIVVTEENQARDMLTAQVAKLSHAEA